MSEENIFDYLDPTTDPTLITTRVGTFGGPDDKEDNGKFAGGGPGSTLPDGSINPENYAALPEELYKSGLVKFGQSFDVTNPKTGQSITVVARDVGPSTRTGRGLDLAPHAAQQLGLDTDQRAVIDLKQFMQNKPPTPHPTQGDAIRSAISEYPTMASQEPTEEAVQATGLGDVNPPDESSTMQPDEVAQQQTQQQPQSDNFVLPTAPQGITAVRIPGTNTFKLSNGYTYDKDSQTVTYPDPSGNGSWTMQRGQKPIFHGASAGRQTPEDVANAAVARKGLLRSQYPAGPQGDEQFATARTTLLGEEKPDVALAKAVAGINVGTTRGPDVLSQVPAQFQDDIKAIAEYRYPKLSGFALKSPYYQKLLSIVQSYNPQFDVKKYDQLAALMKDYGSGKTKDAAVALNTAIPHLADTYDSFQDLSNYGMVGANWAKNKVVSATGHASVGKFNIAKDTASTEIARALQGGAPHESEIQLWQNKFSDSSSPAQMNGQVAEAMKLLSGRLVPYAEQWKKISGKDLPYNLLGPNASDAVQHIYDSLPEGSDKKMVKDAMDKMGVGKPSLPDTGTEASASSTAPSTGTPTPPSDQAVYAEAQRVLATSGDPTERDQAERVISSLRIRGIQGIPSEQ